MKATRIQRYELPGQGLNDLSFDESNIETWLDFLADIRLELGNSKWVTHVWLEGDPMGRRVRRIVVSGEIEV